MRNGQNNKRMRNRNNNNNNNNHNRRSQNPMTRVFESNGPDIKIRGTASHVAEKYVQLARDARSSGDPVASENYYQHAEHYFRLIAAAQEQFRQNQPQQQRPGPEQEMSDDASGDNDADGYAAHYGQEPGFAPQAQQPQPSFQPREQQPYPRDNHQPREHRPQPQYQPQPVVSGDGDDVDRLPSFITGAQPPSNGGQGGLEGNGGGHQGNERFPRRRRRPHGGPRPDNIGAASAPAGDFNPGNE